MSNYNVRDNNSDDENDNYDNNDSFNFGTYLGITTLMILIPIGICYRKEIKKCIEISYEWYIITLKNDILNKEINILRNEKEKFIYNLFLTMNK